MERSAKILAGLMVCVYCLSYAPAILDLTLKTPGDTNNVFGRLDDNDDHKLSRQEYEAWRGKPVTFDEVGADEDGFVTIEAAQENPQVGDLFDWDGSRAGLLFYFVLLVQLADVLQYGWGKLIGRHVIAPNINASRTWEGFCGGVASATLFGVILAWVTPFSVWGSACMAMVIAVMGFAGGMTMSAIKRDRGVQDYGTLVQGHAGVLDRIDSLCFSAPVFFHLAPYLASMS